jgi:hypothetical protein
MIPPNSRGRRTISDRDPDPDGRGHTPIKRAAPVKRRERIGEREAAGRAAAGFHPPDSLIWIKALAQPGENQKGARAKTISACATNVRSPAASRRLQRRQKSKKNK